MALRVSPWRWGWHRRFADEAAGAQPATLTPASSWGSEDASPPLEEASIEAAVHYRPPFAFTSDMLFALAFAPAAPLRRAFPGVPFVALAGRTPLLVWFSRVRQGCAVSADGEWRCEGGDSEMLYHEVTVIGLLRRRALFVPGIYATSVRSTLLARHYYRMPKETVAMSLSTRGARFEAHGLDGACRSRLRAQLLGSGHWPAWFLRPLWPLRVWPVLFPAGTHVEAVVDAAPRVYLAAVSEGRLRVNAPWLRRPVRLLPLGLYVPALRLRLLPPPHWCDPL